MEKNFETLLDAQVETVEFDKVKADLNLKGNDWSSKTSDGKGETA